MVAHGLFANLQAVPNIAVAQPLGHQREHRALARGELGDRVLRAGAHQQLGDDFRVQRRTARGDAPFTSYIADTLKFSGNGSLTINMDLTKTTVPIPDFIRAGTGGLLRLTQ